MMSLQNFYCQRDRSIRLNYVTSPSSHTRLLLTHSLTLFLCNWKKRGQIPPSEQSDDKWLQVHFIQRTVVVRTVKLVSGTHQSVLVDISRQGSLDCGHELMVGAGEKLDHRYKSPLTGLTL